VTKQITIKLNYNQFRPLLDELTKFAGKGITDSDSDNAGKALFYSYRSIMKKHPDLGKSTFDVITETRKMTKPEALLEFLNDYQRFKKSGLAAFATNIKKS
jgi:hypothetical protein